MRGEFGIPKHLQNKKRVVPTSCMARWDREQPLQRFIELNPGGGGLVPILQAVASMLKSVSTRPSAGIAFPTCGRQLHVARNFRCFSPSPGFVLLRLYILAQCILIFGRPSMLLVGVFPLTPLHFHHFRAPSLPRRSTQARFWTPPFDAPCQWV